MSAGSGFVSRYFHAQDDLRLHVRDYGERSANRTPVLCLTGLTRNSGDFDGLARRLAVERRVLCLDYRGRGESDRDPNWRHYVPEVYVGDILHLLALANLHRVIVIGTSLGGLLAMALAVAHPGALAGVILNDAGPEVPEAARRRILDYYKAPHRPADWEAAVAHLRAAFPQLGPATPEKWRRFAENSYREGAHGRLDPKWDPAIIRPLLAGIVAVDLWPLYRALGPIPTLVLRGERSDVLTAATFDRMAEVKPDLERALVPGVGHAPWLDEPEAAGAFDAFLAHR